MKAALPPMSRRPMPMSLGGMSRGIRQGRRPTTMIVTRSKAWSRRAITSGPRAVVPDSCPMHVLNTPVDRPAASAQAIPDGREGSAPGARVTRTTATKATRIPTMTAGCGIPSTAIPTMTGTTADNTPVVGATTPIRPTARPWYRHVIPTSPAKPATTASAVSGVDGNGSPRTTASPRAAKPPIACVTATTESTGARRVTSPPPKSPDPQKSAEARPRTTPATPGARSASGRLLESGVAVDRRRALEDHDLVGLVVVALRGGQVDHLEVARDLAQELEGAGGAAVVERHERVVQDERRPPVAGHEPDQAEASGQVDDVERALAELRDGHPVIALRREHVDAQVLVVDAD